MYDYMGYGDWSYTTDRLLIQYMYDYMGYGDWSYTTDRLLIQYMYDYMGYGDWSYTTDRLLIQYMYDYMVINTVRGQRCYCTVSMRAFYITEYFEY